MLILMLKVERIGWRRDILKKGDPEAAHIGSNISSSVIILTHGRVER